MQPGGKAHGVADGQADEESHQRAFQLGSLEPGVAGQQRDQHGQPIQRQQALAEFRDVVADAGGADGQRYQQQRIQVDERGQRLAEGGQTFAGRAPAAELHGDELERTGFASQQRQTGQRHHAQADEDGPAVFLTVPGRTHGRRLRVGGCRVALDGRI